MPGGDGSSPSTLCLSGETRTPSTTYGGPPPPNGGGFYKRLPQRDIDAGWLAGPYTRHIPACGGHPMTSPSGGGFGCRRRSGINRSFATARSRIFCNHLHLYSEKVPPPACTEGGHFHGFNPIYRSAGPNPSEL